jgi:hypothetical protein
MSEEKAYEAEKKLCFTEGSGNGDTVSVVYRTLVEDPQYVCKACRRVARDEKYLCAPERL